MIQKKLITKPKPQKLRLYLNKNIQTIRFPTKEVNTQCLTKYFNPKNMNNSTSIGDSTNKNKNASQGVKSPSDISAWS